MKRYILLLFIFFTRNLVIHGQSCQYEIAGYHILNDTVFNQFETCIKFANDTFSGKATFDNIQFNKLAAFKNILFYSPPSFNNLLFKDDAEFENIFFKTGNVVFTSSRFHGGLTISNCHFDSVNFAGAKFNGDTLNRHTSFFKDTFSKRCDFTCCKFKRCNFEHTRFVKEVFFDKDTFSNIRFDDTHFDSIASFSEAVFDTVYFNNDTFRNKANFRCVTFKNIANFSGCRFYKTADFSCLNIGEKSNLFFDKTFLPDSIDFSNNPVLHNVINLSIIDSFDYNMEGPKCTCAQEYLNLFFNSVKDGIKHYFLVCDNKKIHHINLFNSDISKIKIDYIKFRLYFKDTTSNSLLKISMEKKLAIYQTLLKDFENRGLSESYKNLDIEYQKVKGRNSVLHWRSWLPDWWWRFGYEKERIFLHIALFLLLFTIINFFCLPFLNNKVYKIDVIPSPIPFHEKGKLFLRLWYAFVYTSILFFLFSLKVENIRFNKKLGTFYLLVIYTAGIICIGYLANFILQK